MTNRTAFAWTTERVEQLKRLWADGFPASQIAAQMGCHSRNTVIGKAHRLKLNGRKRGRPSMTPKAIAERARRRAAAPAKSSKPRAAQYLVRHSTEPEPPKPLPKVDAGPDTSHNCTIFQLTNTTCRWPIWPDNQMTGLYCGAPGADLEQRVLYCPAHAVRAFNAPRN